VEKTLPGSALPDENNTPAKAPGHLSSWFRQNSWNEDLSARWPQSFAREEEQTPRPQFRVHWKLQSPGQRLAGSCRSVVTYTMPWLTRGICTETVTTTAHRRA